MDLAYPSILMIRVQPHFPTDPSENASLYSRWASDSTTTAAIYPLGVRPRVIEKGSERSSFMPFLHFSKAGQKEHPTFMAFFWVSGYPPKNGEAVRGLGPPKLFSLFTTSLPV